MRFALVIILTGGCSIIFAPGDPPTLRDVIPPDGAGDAGDASLDANSASIDASITDARELVCNPLSGACGCYVDNDPAGGPACGVSGSGAELSACHLSRECLPGLFCTGFITTLGECRYLCGGPSGAICGSGTCVSTYFDGYDWWGYCPPQ